MGDVCKDRRRRRRRRSGEAIQPFVKTIRPAVGQEARCKRLYDAEFTLNCNVLDFVESAFNKLWSRQRNSSLKIDFTAASLIVGTWKN